MQEAIRKAGILIEALPYIRDFNDKVIVIKYGGSALTSKRKRMRVLEDIVFMSYAGMHPVVVHGGGPHISKKLEESNAGTAFIDGLRVTGEKEIKVITEVLTTLNRRIVRELRSLGGRAKAVSGKKIIRVIRHKRSRELGFVGEIRHIEAKMIADICERGTIPVISPLGIGRDGCVYNINADQAAAAIAKALHAEKLALLTNVDGVRTGSSSSSIISSLTRGRARRLIKEGAIASGMIPKVKSCMYAIEGGVGKAHIVNGSLSHALLLEIYTDQGIGTEVIKR